MNNHSLLRTVAGAAALLAGAVFTASSLSAQSTTYNFSLLAGSGASLGSGSAPSSNVFFNPQGMAVDTSGNIYVADAGDHTVKKISGSTVTVIAGASGQAGTQNFATAASSARFIYPYAVAVDTGGNVYVADQGANAIFKISGSNVSLVAGSPGTAGSANGNGSAATFNGPRGIAVDGSGNLYVSDTNNSLIRKIDTAGNVTTLAGSAGVTGSSDGSGGSALFNFPQGIVFDAKTGNLYVADYDNSTIRSVTTAGTVATVAGNASATGAVNGAATGGATFNHPAAVAVDGNGNIYVLDTSNQLVREVSAGVVTTVAGNVTGGHAAGLFFYPQGLAVTSSGSIYVADTGNHEIKSVTGGAASILVGAMGSIGFTGSTFNYPYGIAVGSNGNVYVADSGNNAIRVISSGGAVSTLAGTGVAGSADGPATTATFNNPSAVAVDSAGNVYIADTGNSTIRKFTASTNTVSTISGTAGTTGSNNGAEAGATYNHPQGIAVDSSGDIFVADTDNSVIREISGGQVSTYAGTVGQTGTADNVRTQALFNGPTSVAVDSSGNVWVADFSNNTIRKIPAGSGSTVTIGVPTSDGGDVDGTAGQAQFNQPSQIAVDALGDVFVADTFNHDIRLISNNAVSTLGGNASRFYNPQGVAVSASGALYVADGDNQSVDVGAAQLPTPILSSHTIPVGGSTTFNLGSYAPSGASIQWQLSTTGVGGSFNSIGGQSGTSLAITGATAAMNGYAYRAVVNGTTTPAATLYVGTARLINLSTRAAVSGSNTVTAGFYVAGTGTKNLVIRGIGPALAGFGVSNYLADPTLNVNAQAGPTLISSDTTGWGGSSTIANDMASVGAFSLSATSMDEVLVPALAISGSTGFTAVVGSKSGGTGQVLAEVYDMDTSGTPATRLNNLSTMAYVDNGGTNTLTSGFVITGSVPETLLIRGDGPSLAAFGVTGFMATPTITVFNGSQAPVQSNSGWQNNNAIATAAAQVGAFAFQSGSADAAIVISLNPGTYTVQLTGASGSTGKALLEIYEVQ